MQYRREIDGLRAVAVIPVILFHAGAPIVRGGFVGVDIFFVISGYLITGILLRELDAGELSIARFYERRARRILPALCVIIACCLPFAWVWMPPSQLKQFAQSVMAVALFASNILFHREEGYFAAAAEAKPLLHTWSLAVEEQFYLALPVALLCFWRLGRRTTIAIIAAAMIASFTYSAWLTQYDPGAAFYLAPTRAWELLAGSLCAFIPLKRMERNDSLGIAGIGVILLCILYYDEQTPFPGIAALAPVAGTVLIILYCRPGTWAGRLLGHRVPVGIGLVSYSAYLLHQPLFAFARIRSVPYASPALMTLVTFCIFPLAYLSWRYVEKPVRRGSFSRRAIFAWSAAAMVLLAAAGLAGHVMRGMPQRSAALVAADRQTAINMGLSEQCEDRLSLSSKCATVIRPTVLLWGDSYAMHLAAGLSSLPLRQMTKSSCAPILGIAMVSKEYPASKAKGCIAFNDAVIHWLERDTAIRTVVLSTSFALLDHQIIARDGDMVGPDTVEIGMRRTIARIQRMGRRVVLISPTPESGRDIGQCLARLTAFGGPANACDFPAPMNTEKFRLIDRLEPFVKTVRLDEQLCRKGCVAASGGVALFRDRGHLSKDGSAYLGQRFAWPGSITD